MSTEIDFVAFCMAMFLCVVPHESVENTQSDEFPACFGLGQHKNQLSVLESSFYD